MASDKGIGKSVLRKEDLRLLTGTGSFTDDVSLDGQAHAYLLRSPHAHARIRSIDVAPAFASPGVLAALTARDYLSDGAGPILHVANPPDINDPKTPAFRNRDGTPVFVAPHFPMAEDMVRYVGEGVCFVVAESLEAAKDAAERIVVDYEVLPAVTQSEAAMQPGAPSVWDGARNNVAFDSVFGEEAAVAEAFSKARHVVSLKLVNQRITAMAMEPRGAVAAYHAASGCYTLYSGSQGAVRQQTTLMKMFGVPAEQMRVVCRDVGGGFGMKNWVYPEFVLALWAARRLGRPVKWIADRTESFLADFQARDLITEGELAIDDNGRFLALRISNVGNVGGHTVAFVSLANGSRIVTSIYDIPLALVRVRGVLTHTAPTAPYRGAGRPEAMHNLERLIDEAARVSGIDRVEIRRRNLIAPSKLPYRNPLGVTYDCGDFHTNMEKVLEISDWKGFDERRASSSAKGRLRGIGLSNYLETPVGWPQERAEITVRTDGIVDVILGTQGHGQGHETTFAQVMVSQLGVPFDTVNLITGDTAIVKEGGGSHSDRSMRLAGSLMFWGCAEIVEKGRRIAAHVLETSTEDIEFSDGRFVVRGTDRTLELFEAARLAQTEKVPQELRGRLGSDQEIWRRVPAYPTGSAVCEVEVDPDTGRIEIVRWSCVDDVGRVINPMIVHGQAHGGIAQGIGQLLMEHSHYNEDGQLIAASLMDYALPRAADVPRYAVTTSETALTAGNPLGIKGGGECGTTPALAAGMNAIVDALRSAGIHHFSMPATPARIWQALRDAPRASPSQ